MQRSPDAYQPRITAWGHTWRMLLVAAISALAWGNVAAAQWDQERTLFWVDVGLGAMSFVLVGFRRRAPLTVAVVLALCSAVSGIAGGPATLAAVSLATRRRIVPVVVVGVVSLVAAQAFATVMPGPQHDEPYLLNLTINLSVIVAALATGMYIGSRRELLWNLRERATRAETEQELRVAQARANERALIAREMHDVLAHRISQVSMHAGALAFRDDLSPDEVKDSAAVIQQKSHEALVDLRQVLGVLRDGRTGQVLDTPQPTFADVPALVEEARALGMRVRYDDDVDRRADLPDRAGRTAYRIVQEGLTNARKHAPGVEVTLRVAGTPEDGIDVSVSNPLPSLGGSGTPGAGLGLVGLAERTELAGGRLEQQATPTRFTLHGWIPWTA